LAGSTHYIPYIARSVKNSETDLEFKEMELI